MGAEKCMCVVVLYGRATVKEGFGFILQGTSACSPERIPLSCFFRHAQKAEAPRNQTSFKKGLKKKREETLSSSTTTALPGLLLLAMSSWKRPSCVGWGPSTLW